MKLALGIEYQGSAYCGWQRQRHSPSVQQQLEQALSYVADHAVELICAGRTDSGVHACEQVVHFETEAERPDKAWILGTNTRLPRDIRVLWVQIMTADFHARFSAVARSYRYVIMNAPVPTALFHNQVCSEYRPLDETLMHQSAQYLLGKHDFSSFRAAGCQAKSPIRHVEYLNVTRNGDMIYIDIKANAFLHHMVRNISGSLMMVGRQEQPAEWIDQVLEGRDRRQAAMTAPAQGLYFIRAFYPETFELPQQTRLPLMF